MNDLSVCPDCNEATTVVLPTGGRVGRPCKCQRERWEQIEADARASNVVNPVEDGKGKIT